MKVRVICGPRTDTEAIQAEVSKALADKSVGTIVVHKAAARYLAEWPERVVDLRARPEPVGAC